jgi:hypothetical protein
MAPRAIFLPATVLLFCAFILSLIVSVSLPALPTADIARVHFTNGTSPHLTTDTELINQIRVRHISTLSTASLLCSQKNSFLFSFRFISLMHSLAFGGENIFALYDRELTR